MTPRTFLLILRARWWLVAAVLALVVAVVAAISFNLDKQYTATASVIFDVRSDPVEGGQTPASLLPAYLATQIDVILSDRVANRVIQQTGMANSPLIVAQWREATKGRGTFEDWLADALRRNLEVAPSRESAVINISFTGVDPRFAALIANAYANAFVAANLELKTEPARQYATFFDERIAQLRKNLVAAQTRLSNYQREKGIVGANNVDVESTRMADLSSQLAAAQVQSAGTAARRQQTAQSGGAAPDVFNSPVVQQLRADIARQSAALKELSSRLGPNHPQYQQSAAQLAELRARLSGEEQQAAAAVASASRSDSSREASLRASLTEQRRRVLAVSTEKDALSVLQRDVEAAQRAYDGVAQRLTQSQLESEVQQTNVSILSPATEPTVQSRPNVRLNILLAIFIGTFIGVTAALLMEMADRRVRSGSELDLPGVPVLADLSARGGGWLAKLGGWFGAMRARRAAA